jgi:hypothetical protein
VDLELLSSDQFPGRAAPPITGSLKWQSEPWLATLATSVLSGDRTFAVSPRAETFTSFSLRPGLGAMVWI